MRIAAVVERLNYGTASGSLRRDAWYVSGTYRLGAGSVRAGFARASDGSGPSTETVGFFRSGSHTAARQLTAGYEYELSRRTALQGYVSRLDNDSSAIYDFAINGVGAQAGQRLTVVALGLRHSF